MKKILITGGAGFIGSKLSLLFLSKGYNVTIIDNLSEQIHGRNYENSFTYNLIKNKVNFIKDSILSKQNLEKAISDNEIIVHLAAHTGTGQSMYKIFDYVNENINGTALLLDILANTKHNIKKIIVASSRAVYGEGKYKSKYGNILYPKNRTLYNLENKKFDLYDEDNNEKLICLPTDENSKIHPSSVYGITKQNQEDLIMKICPTLGIEPIALRFQNVYGPGQSLHNPYTGILSIFSTLIKNNKEINIFEDGLESRDFIYIDDVINATFLCIESEKANNNIYNVGTGIQTTVLEVANQLIKNYNINVALNISGNFRLGDIRHNFADTTKIKNQLNFIPKFSFKEGLKLFTEWVNSQEILNNNFEKSLIEMKQKGLLK